MTTTKNKIKIINSYAVKCNEEKLKLTILFNNELLLYNIAIHYTYIKKGRNTIENNVTLTHESVYIYSENCVLEA